MIGDLTGLLATLKALPLSYNRDLQEDKEPVFAASDALDLSLAAMAGMLADLTIDANAMMRAAEKGYPTATDLADWLVKNLKTPFREAHAVAAKAVAKAESMGVALKDVPLKELEALEPRITNDVFKVLSLEASVAARTSFGGTAPSRVKEQIAFWKGQTS